MKLLKSKYSIAMSVFAFPALIIGSWAPYKDVSSFFVPSYVMTEAMAHDFMSKNESYLSDGNVAALLDGFHEDFRMDIVHATGRKETLNKSQYRKHYEMISMFGMTHSQNHDVVKIKALAKDRLEVTLIVNQSFKSERLSLLNHDNINFQTMELVNDGGQIKLLRATSNVRAVSSNMDKYKNSRLIASK